jgi:DNA modification methylase
MGYAPASASLLDDVVSLASRVCSGWFVAFNDFDGAHHIRASVKQRGAVSAEPIAWVKPPTLTPPRGVHNLPGKGTEFIIASRFKPLARSGLIPGSYVSPRNTPGASMSLFVTGGKPIDLMRAIVRDFTRPGDLIVEPFSGGGTTLLAAVMEGRRAIGAEMDAGRFEIAVKRLRKGYTTSLFAEHEAEMKQEVLF